jgi:hypothetical protein
MNSQPEQTVCSQTPVKAMTVVATHAIRWKSFVNGSIGTAPGLFAKEEAERLATELNEKYPDIDHEAVIPSPPSAEPEVAEPAHQLSG